MNIDFILANEIKNIIETRNMQPGDHLPSERELCEMFSCQRLSIRSGLKLLEDQGIIYSKPKSGYYINKKRISKNTTSISSVTDEMFQLERNAQTKLLDCTLIEANSDQIRFLDCTIGTKFYRIKRLRIVDDEPICLDISYVNAHRCPALDKKDLESLSLYRILNHDYSIQLDSSIQAVDVICADDAIATNLQIACDTKIIYQHGAVYDGTGVLIEYSDSYMKPDWFEYTSR